MEVKRIHDFAKALAEECKADIPRVMVVEDNPTDRMFILEALRPLRVETIPVSSGEEALERAAYDKDICVVFLDLRHSKLSGAALYDQIRKALPDSQIVIVSADDPEVKKILAKGPVHVVAKPLKTEYATEILRRSNLPCTYADDI